LIEKNNKRLQEAATMLCASSESASDNDVKDEGKTCEAVRAGKIIA